MSYKLQLEVVEPEFMYFSEYWAQSLRWFIKETLSKFSCELGNFGHKNHRQNTVRFSRRDFRIIPNTFLRGASAMKLRRMQRWFDRSPVNMFPEPVFTLDFSTKMSIIQWFLFQPYWIQSCTLPRTGVHIPLGGAAVLDSTTRTYWTLSVTGTCGLAVYNRDHQPISITVLIVFAFVGYWHDTIN